MYYSDYNRPPEDRDPMIEASQFHVYDAEPPKQKKKGGLGKFIAVGLCCAILGGAVFDEQRITVSDEPGLGIKGVEKITYLD